MSELSLLKTIPKELETSNVLNLRSDDFIMMEAACNEPSDIFDDKAILRQNI